MLKQAAPQARIVGLDPDPAILAIAAAKAAAAARFTVTVDALSTNVVAGTLVNVTSWYDNEMGYSARCVDLLRYVGEQL